MLQNSRCRFVLSLLARPVPEGTGLRQHFNQAASEIRIST